MAGPVIRGVQVAQPNGFTVQRAPFSVQQDTLPEQLSQAGVLGSLGKQAKHPLLSSTFIAATVINGSYADNFIAHNRGSVPMAVLPCVPQVANIGTLKWVRSTVAAPYDETKYVNIQSSASTNVAFLVF